MHDVNVVLDSSVPVIVRAFPSPTDPETFPSVKVNDSNEHEVMVQVVPDVIRIIGLLIDVGLDAPTTWMEFRVNVPELSEKIMQG